MNITAIAAGFVVGLLVGMTGMGGGALMTPFLILVMKVHPVLAVGTDLVFATVTKAGSAIQHYRQQTAWLRPVFWMALGSLPASFLGSRFLLANVENEHVVEVFLPITLGVMLLLVGLVVLARVFGLLGFNNEPQAIHWPPPWALVGIGIAGGLLTGLTSAGGGTVILALLIIFFAIPPAQMVGFDVTHGALLALFSALNYSLAGQVDWGLAAWLLVGSIPGSLLGSRVVKVLPQRFVRGMIGGLLLLAATSILFNQLS